MSQPEQSMTIEQLIKELEKDIRRRYGPPSRSSHHRLWFVLGALKTRVLEDAMADERRRRSVEDTIEKFQRFQLEQYMESH